jgi:hypothetical protein
MPGFGAMMSRMSRLLPLFVFGLGTIIAPHASGQAEPAVATQLMAGTVGSLRIGMSQPEVESLLRRRIEVDSKVDFPLATITGNSDLQALGIEKIAGAASTGADLQFDNPSDGLRHLRSVAIGIRCDDMNELRRQLIPDVAMQDIPTIDTSPYAWRLSPNSGCYLSLWLTSDQLN